MGTKSLIMFFAVVGSTLGGFIPNIWHASAFSVWGVIFGIVGGIAGIWVGYRLANG